MWNNILAHKKKLIALLLAAVLAIAGINISQQQQDAIVDTVSDALPDAPANP